MIPKIANFFEKNPTTLTVQVEHRPYVPFPVPATIDVRDPNGVKVGVARNLHWEGSALLGEIHYEPGFGTDYLLQYAEPDSLSSQDSVS